MEVFFAQNPFKIAAGCTFCFGFQLQNCANCQIWVLTKIGPDADFVPCFYAKQRCSTKEHSSKYFPKFIFVFF